MQSLRRVRSVLVNFADRLRLMLSRTRTMFLTVEVRSEGSADVIDVQLKPDCPSQITGSKNLKKTLRVTFSDTSIEILGSRSGTDASDVLTEETLAVVMKNHPKMQDVTHMFVIQHSCLSSVPVLIGKLTNLTMLDLSANSLQDLPWSIVCLNKLKVLNLSRNQFYILPPIVGHLRSLEQLLLNDNCLEYLPTSLLQLEKLLALEMSGNAQIRAPPLAICNQGLDAVFRHLRKRTARKNLWSNSTHFYEPQFREQNENGNLQVKSLLEICVANVLRFNLDFFSQPFVPPPLKRHLYDSYKTKMATVWVAKCSQCKCFFSTEAFFEGHDCRL
ncbi:uncharacterized protein LOC143296418 [Babylonia areolata]|uniref:uncharacterized protein LOC143296418 n=1 Tax=Babylonia areolata TaxID=304850 RepID=UPI003FD551CF